MNFEKKSLEEISKMTADEKDKYFAAKEAHDLEVRKNELETVKTESEKAAKEAAEKAIDEKLKSQGEMISKQDFEDYKTKTTAMIENIGKAAGNQTESGMTDVAKDFLQQYEERTKEIDKSEALKGVIRIKAWDSTDTMSATDVPAGTYPANGTTSAIGSVLTFLSKLIPVFYRKPRPTSKVYDYVSVIPAEGETSVTVISEDIIGEAELVDECELKPIVKLDYKATTVEMKPLAVFWKITRVLLRVFKKLGVDVQKRFNELIMEKVPNAILEAVKDAGVPFTAVPDLAVHTEPNNFDAIVSVIAYLEKFGHTPNVVLVSPYGFANMTTKKATDGHYMLSNGGSIKLVGSTIDYGGSLLEIIKDPTLGNDDLIIGDLTAVQVHLDGNVEFHQGYEDDDLRRNLVSNVLEQYVAIVVPEGAELGIISDTFANVKNLITD